MIYRYSIHMNIILLKDKKYCYCFTFADKIVSELDNHAPEPLVKNNEMLPIAQLSDKKISGGI